MMSLKVSQLPCRCGVKEIAPLEKPIFIADLHLSWRKISALLHFFKFLKGPASSYKELFIVGDLFEYWLGDDAGWIASPIARALRHFADNGHKVYLMHGNRDLLIGDDFAHACHATLLADSIVVTHNQTNLLVTHGDIWCTLDKDYQKFRKKLSSYAFQKDAFTLNLRERIAIATKARATSIKEKKVKTQAEMDVVEEDVLKDAKAAHCKAIIHGHIHRAAVHKMGTFTRYVLPDWNLGFTESPHHGWITLENGVPTLTLLER